MSALTDNPRLLAQKPDLCIYMSPHPDLLVGFFYTARHDDVAAYQLGGIILERLRRFVLVT